MTKKFMLTRLGDSMASNDDLTRCTESETCCKFKDETDAYEDSIVIESNEIPKTVVNRKCGKRNFVGMESRISEGDTAHYGKENEKNCEVNVSEHFSSTYSRISLDDCHFDEN